MRTCVIFCAAGFELSLRITQGRFDACETVKNIGEGFDYIVCSGGDGTLNEVISGVLSLNKQPLIGYIPSGSTNDFASNLGLVKNDFKGGAKRIIEGSPRAVDVGLIGNRYFSYTASFGAFTAITYTTPQNVKNILGRAAYFLEAPKDLTSLRPYKVKVTDKEKEIFLVFGKETKGLPEDLLSENYSSCIRIPMRENMRSLNLSNSVAIIAYEVLRQFDYENLKREGELTNGKNNG